MFVVAFCCPPWPQVLASTILLNINQCLIGGGVNIAFTRSIFYSDAYNDFLSIISSPNSFACLSKTSLPIQQIPFLQYYAVILLFLILSLISLLLIHFMPIFFGYIVFPAQSVHCLPLNLFWYSPPLRTILSPTYSVTHCCSHCLPFCVYRTFAYHCYAWFVSDLGF